MPLAGTIWAALLPGRGHVAFGFVPVFCYFATASGIVSFGLIEAPTATAWFWMVLYHLLFAPERRVWLTVALISLAPITHEVTAMLSPLLAAAAFLRTRQASGRVFRALLCIGVAYLLIASAIEAIRIFHPHNQSNRDGLIDDVIGLHWLNAPGNGFNLAAILGLSAVGTLLVAYCLPRLRGASVAVFVGLCLACGGGVWAWPAARAQLPYFAARDLGAFASFFLTPIVLTAWRHPTSGCSHLIAFAARQRMVLAALALATSTIQLALNRDWAAYTDEFRAVIVSRDGLVSWQEVVSGAPQDKAALLRRLVWGWTNPDLSLLFQGGATVRTIVANPQPAPGDKPWRPWEPADPKTWPQGSRFDMRNFRPE